MNKKRKTKKVPFATILAGVPKDRHREAGDKIASALGWKRSTLYNYRREGLPVNYYGLEDIYKVLLTIK